MVKAGNIAGFEVTYIETGLFVRATISKITTGGLVFDSHVNLTEGSIQGSYWGYHVPPLGSEIAYYIEIHAYTDDTYAMVDPDYAGSTRSYQSVIWPNFLGANEITGYIDL